MSQEVLHTATQGNEEDIPSDVLKTKEEMLTEMYEARRYALSSKYLKESRAPTANKTKLSKQFRSDLAEIEGEYLAARDKIRDEENEKNEGTFWSDEDG